MEYVNYLGNQYAGLISVVGSIIGIVGFIFGIWRYFRERRASQALKDSQQKLDNALARLNHLNEFASKLKQYSAAV
jgi:uncharacterized membrane-anchored protein YhcB (DUF1043 family)